MTHPPTPHDHLYQQLARIADDLAEIDRRLRKVQAHVVACEGEAFAEYQASPTDEARGFWKALRAVRLYLTGKEVAIL